MERLHAPAVLFANNNSVFATMAVIMDTKPNDRAWELMKKVGICMLTTREGETLHARPMGAYVREDDGIIYFLTDARRHKDEEIRANPNVCLAFADTGGQKYVSVSAKAEVSNDRAKIKELFSTPAKAWWDSENDPNIRVLKVRPSDAEYWDGPGTVVSYVKMTVAAITGTRPEIGDNRKVAL
jgi:general stress protein 26